MTSPPVPQIPTDSPYFGTSGAGQSGYCPEGNARNRCGSIIFFHCLTPQQQVEAAVRARKHLETQAAISGAGVGTARMISAWFRYEKYWRGIAEGRAAK